MRGHSVGAAEREQSKGGARHGADARAPFDRAIGGVLPPCRAAGLASSTADGVSLDLLINAIVAGILLGGFYAAVTVGITISFGMLDIANIAQPAFILLGSYAAYIVTGYVRIDPILVGFIMTPVFYVIGMATYRLYYHAFESRGEQAIQGLAFFFGLLFVGEVSLVLVFGVDYRFVEAPYIGPSLHLGFCDLPLRMLIPCVVSLVMVWVLAALSDAQLYRSGHPRGIAGPLALRCSMAASLDADSSRSRSAYRSCCTCALAGNVSS